MFVQNLNERQQSALLHYADAVMRVDNRVEPSELVAMDLLRDQAHPGVQPKDVPVDQLGELFKNRIGRVSFLLELVGMGYVNDDFDPRQSILIDEVAAALDMRDDGTLEAVESWVVDQLELMKKAQQLMQGR
ncbi:MAG: hypothetical protein OXJ64_09645 [Boseongicola sp.]|nr:hypothetical protein [Boseongicola sp.]